MRQLQDIKVPNFNKILLGLFLLVFGFSFSLNASSNALSGEISGSVFVDENINGVNDDSYASQFENLIEVSSVIVYLYDEQGKLLNRTLTDALGQYKFTQLNPNDTYRVEFKHDKHLVSSLETTKDRYQQVSSGNNVEVNYAVVLNSSSDDQQIGSTYSKTSNKLNQFNQLHINTSFSYDAFINYATFGAANGQSTYSRNTSVHMPATNNWNNEGRVPFQVTDDYAAEENPNSSAATVFESALTEQSVNARTALEQSELTTGVAFVVLDSGVSEACYCLANADLGEVGQFVNVLSITTDVPGETWQIISASGIEQGITTPDEESDLSTYVIGDQVATVPFATGMNAEALYEDAQDGSSIYSFAGVSADGDVFEVEVTNGSDTVTITGGSCNYNEQIILGQENVCESSVTSYCVEENPGSTYSWSLSGGGVIMTAADAACIEVLWDPDVGGPYTVSVEQTNASLCLNPSTIDVEVGVPGGALACIAKANISLSPDCNLVVTPDLVLESPITGDQVYTVIVTDPDGNELPEPIITAEYVGQEMEVKIMDVCSGNSCWTQITVFDKIKPTVDAQDLTISCNEDPNQPFPLGLDNCDSNPTVELISESIEQLTCNDDFTTEITRVFVATDSEGNESAPTEQKIFLERIDLDSIVFPIDRTVNDGNPVFCQQFDLDENGNPAPSTAGVPTYKGLSLYPYQDQFCSFGISYTDLVVAPNSCVTKVMRTWTAYEWWCGQSIVETVIQEINIADQADPTFEVPADITVTTNVAECVATVDLPAISPEDDCSETFEIDIQYPGGFLNNSNGGLVDVELGTSTITYTVYDACLNSTSHSFTITVEDNTQPVMVCDQNSVISLNVDGIAYAPASVFDDGTIEDCTDLTFEVLRMDNGAACGVSNTEFGPFVEFCCADVGETVQVLLKATDENNNTNTCMVNVVVQDKNPPVLTVPADLTIECTDPYDPANLGLTFGTASATDNCLNTTITEESNIAINDCNTGFIVRTFTASDGNGEAVGTQTITVQNSNVFALSDITWPSDFTTDESCDVEGLQPEDLEAPFNMPVLTPDACDMIDLGFTDQTFTMEDDACFKVIRRWMVMDMCNIQSDGSPMMFMHDQTIVVTNSVDPIITTSCDSISSSLNADCDEGFISLTASATDDCTATENISNSYFIDINNDGSFDQTETSVGGTILVEGFYPLGTHRIVYEFEDRCGNDAVCTQMFTIFNNTPPLAKCQDLAVELTPMDTDGDNILDSEMAFLDVELVGGDSETPCGTPFTLSYDTEGDSTVAVFDCFNLGINIVTVYVTDSLSGLQSSCTAQVIIQDNNDVDICPTPEDCIVWPDTNLLVDFCVVDLQPESIFSEAEVTEPCVCGDFDVTFTDVDISSGGNACADIERTWLVTFNCFVLPLEYTFVQTIKQLNAFAPIITSCPDTVFSMSMDGTCFAPVTVGLPTFDSSCSFGVVTTNDSQFSNSSVGAATGSYPVGITDVTYTLTDECGNASTCDVVVVVNDTGAPICNTQDITVTIPSTGGGSVTIAGDAVDNMSEDDCGTIVSYSTTPNTFSCSELGDNTVVMTVTDDSGNSSTCSATVTVEDAVAPLCSAGSLTITLMSNTTVSITGEELDNGSVDTCGTIVSYEAIPNSFSCEDAGVNDVVLIVTDNNGNSSSCIGTVTILDGVAPLCQTMDATIILDANGNYTLDPSEVDGGSSDICGDQISLAVSPNTFTCDSLGDVTVTLTVTDLAGNSSECTATVTVTDTIAPICNAGTANITLFSNTDVTVPASFVDAGSTDDCGTIVSTTITPNVFGCGDIGMNTVILTVTDDSGNSSTCEGFVNVTDNVAPICQVQDITVMVETSGLAIVDALDVDNGSFDDCGMIVSYTVDPDTFDCNDVGLNSVVFTVTDNSGNTCTSVANVTVETMDTLLCVSQDITVFLDENGEVGITPSDIDGGSMAPCGSTVSLSIDVDSFFCADTQLNPASVLLTVTDDMSGETDTCSALVTVLDTLVPTVNCPVDLTFTCSDDLSDASIFGAVTFDDNCPGTLMVDTTVIDNRNNCGVGTIIRRYTAMDLSGNVDSCDQLITIDLGPNVFTEDSITWPMSPFTVIDCSSTDPEALMSFPLLDTMNLDCYNISVDFMDVSVGMGTMCLDTIERTWTVIDSCQLDLGTGTFTFVQTLFIDDSAVPVISGVMDTILFAGEVTCEQFVDLSAAMAEDCTMNLTVSNNSPFADNPNSLDASGVYPLGDTNVTLFATDACGNTDSLTYRVVIQDTLPPVVECQKVFADITANLTVTVFPEQFILTMFDNCTDSTDIEVSFILEWFEGDDDLTDNPMPASITFDCEQLGDNLVNIVYTDESGNSFVCGALTTVLDPNNFCDNAPQGLVVEGDVKTIQGEIVEGTTVSLEGMVNLTTTVASNGLYAFPSVPLFSNATILPYNNSNLLHGITTLDVLMIQNHIMNVNILTSPYDLIAADVDHSESISGNDIISLQKLILGETDVFDNNTSFRFVDSNYEFLDVTDPFMTNFPETADFTNLSEGMSQDFIGIKVGDVNGSFINQPGTDSPTQIDIHTRSTHSLSLESTEIRSSGGFVEVPVYSENFEALQAMEMSIVSEKRIVDVLPGSIDLNKSEFRTSQFGRKLKISWVNPSVIDVRSGDLLFTLVVKSDENLVPADVITLSPSVNEFYTDKYEIAELRFSNETNVLQQAKAVLYQNAPNPWSNETMISFEMVQDGDYMLSFFDIDGKLLTQLTGYASKGYNEVQVSKSEMGMQSGVIVYEFTSGNRKLVKRMVMME